MPFRIDYTPAGALVAAATAAGRARGAQISAAQDAGLARQRMATQAQLVQASMATDMRMQEMELKERAMELQEAASSRMARTPTARKSGVSPVAASIQARLDALQQMKTGGGLPDEQYMNAKLGIITGQRPAQPRVDPTSRTISARMAALKGLEGDLPEDVLQEARLRIASGGTIKGLGAKQRTAFRVGKRAYSQLDRLLKQQTAFYGRETRESESYTREITRVHNLLMSTRKRIAASNAIQGQPDMENLLVLARFATSAQDFLKLMRKLPVGYLNAEEVEELRQALPPEIQNVLARRK